MNRKNDHIELALKQTHSRHGFDAMRLAYEALPAYDVKDVNLSVIMFGQTFPSPFFINAMTGGTQKAKTINGRLAMLAKVFNLPMALGSASVMIQDESVKDSFSIVREVNPNGFLIANLGAHHPLKNVKAVIDSLQANAFEYHLNLAQELAMPEGDRSFQSWRTNIKEVAQNLKIPFIVKEVGFGMNRSTIQTLADLGIRIVNVGGRGGTNFSAIENSRRDYMFEGLNHVGYFTLESLIMAKNIEGVDIFASGGIQTPLDAIKSLVLGAKMVGMSSYFLQLVTTYTHEEAIERFQHFLEEVKMLMMTLSVKTIQDLPKVHYFLDKTSLWID